VKFLKEFASKRFRIALCGAIATLLSWAATTSAQSGSSIPAAPPVFREVTDETGRTVRIPQPVRRIVSLAPSLTETVYALGLEDHLVGDTDYCDYPPDARASIAEVMQQHLANLQEHISALPPKRVLFVVWTQPLISVGKGTFIADALRRAGAVSVVDSEQDWPQVSLEEVARLQPDFLVFAESHSDSASPAVETLATLPGWSIVDAVGNRRFAVISEAVNR